MKSVLGGLLFWDRHEQEAGQAILGGTDLKLVGVVVDDYPAERFSPPLPERARVACIDGRLLPDQGHNLIVEAERPRRDTSHTRCPLRAAAANTVLSTERRLARSADMRSPFSGLPASGGLDRRSRDHALAAVDDTYELVTKRCASVTDQAQRALTTGHPSRRSCGDGPSALPVLPPRGAASRSPNVERRSAASRSHQQETVPGQAACCTNAMHGPWLSTGRPWPSVKSRQPPFLHWSFEVRAARRAQRSHRRGLADLARSLLLQSGGR